MILLAVTVLLGWVALVACCVPASRAADVDPMTALRIIGSNIVQLPAGVCSVAVPAELNNSELQLPRVLEAFLLETG